MYKDFGSSTEYLYSYAQSHFFVWLHTSIIKPHSRGSRQLTGLHGLLSARPCAIIVTRPAKSPFLDKGVPIHSNCKQYDVFTTNYSSLGHGIKVHFQ